MTIYSDALQILQEIDRTFGRSLLDEDAPWEGSLDEWYDYFFSRLEVSLTEAEKQKDTKLILKWVKQKYGAAKAQAHRVFLAKVRKDPAAHRRKMAKDRRYHRLHKWHDKLMRQTARPGFVRKHVKPALAERDPGQAFMDVPFELRVTSNENSFVCPDCNYRGLPSAGKKCPKCHGSMIAEAAKDSGTELTSKGRTQAAQDASKKAGMKVPQHYQKTCSMDSFYKNVQYFYRVKGKEWEGSKKEKLQRAIAASYSVLKKSCGVTSDKRMTPSEIVSAGG